MHLPGGTRPPLKKSWPAPFNELLNECWDRDASRRPPIADVCRRLREMVVVLGGPDAINTPVVEEQNTDDLEED